MHHLSYFAFTRRHSGIGNSEKDRIGAERFRNPPEIPAAQDSYVVYLSEGRPPPNSWNVISNNNEHLMLYS